MVMRFIFLFLSVVSRVFISFSFLGCCGVSSLAFYCLGVIIITVSSVFKVVFYYVA